MPWSMMSGVREVALKQIYSRQKKLAVFLSTCLCTWENNCWLVEVRVNSHEMSPVIKPYISLIDANKILWTINFHSFTCNAFMQVRMRSLKCFPLNILYRLGTVINQSKQRILEGSKGYPTSLGTFLYSSSKGWLDGEILICILFEKGVNM